MNGDGKRAIGGFLKDGAAPEVHFLLDGLRRIVALLDEGGRVTGAASEASSPHGAEPLPLIPPEGLTAEALIAEVERVAKTSVRASRGGWMGHMDPPAAWSSVLGGATAALLNNNLLMPEMSPSLYRLEEQAVWAFARELGLGACAGGTMTAGGSTANLLALTVARNEELRRLDANGADRFEALRCFTVIASADAHDSVRRAVDILGLDPASGLLQVVPGERGELDPQAVERRMRECARSGRIILALVATAGTTVRGAIDPLEELSRMALEWGCWYHVDAAYGGALALSWRRRHLLAGIERADSVTLNPQKWLYVAKVCAMALFRDRAAWVRAMGHASDYALPGEASRGRQIEGTRHADVLKLRLTLLQLGRTGIEELFERSFALAESVEKAVRARPFLRLAEPSGTNIVVFRCAADDDSPDATCTRALRTRLVEEADVFLSMPLYRGERWLRAVLLNPLTDASTIVRMFERIDAFARARGWA